MRDKKQIGLEPIVLAKSFLSLNAVVGCRNDCVYCYKHSWDFKDKFKPHRVFSLDDILSNLTDYPYYSLNVPLAVHNSATDPFQKGVKEVTFDILNGLEEMRIENIVGLITKEYISPEDLKQLESFQYIRPILFITYSGLPKRFEKIVDEKRFETMENLRGTTLKKILYFRPIIRDMNDNEENVAHIVKIGEKYFDAIVRSSVKLDVNAIAYMASKGIFLDPEYDIGLNIHDSLKRLLPESRELVDKNLAKAQIPVFKKTSCAISWAFEQPDYNCQWIRKDIYCTNGCPPEQKERCVQASNKEVDEEQFKGLLERIGKPNSFEVNDNFIAVPGKKFSCSDVKFLRMAMGFPVLAEINGECLTAEEQDIKCYNKDRKDIRNILRQEMRISNY